MKPGIHPEYAPAIISCACGEVIHTRSTLQALRVEICSKCHPLFTGRQKLIDSEGRVERYQRKYGRKPVTTEPSTTEET
jgi:large subunit ribosomal protein L31